MTPSDQQPWRIFFSALVIGGLGFTAVGFAQGVVLVGAWYGWW